MAMVHFADPSYIFTFLHTSAHLYIVLYRYRYKQIQERYRKLVEQDREDLDNNSRSGRHRRSMALMEELQQLIPGRPAIHRLHGLDMDTAVAAMGPDDVFGKSNFFY